MLLILKVISQFTHVHQVHSDGVSILVSCLKTWFSMSRSWLSLDTCMSCLGSVSSYHVSSSFTSLDCVLTASLSGIAKWLFCVETLNWPVYKSTVLDCVVSTGTSAKCPMPEPKTDGSLCNSNTQVCRGGVSIQLLPWRRHYVLRLDCTNKTKYFGRL